jgi:hypothetical protein
MALVIERLWLTPTVVEIAGGPGRYERRKAYRESIGRHWVPGCLAEQVQWPTPTAQEVEHPDAVLSPTGRRLTKNGQNSHSLNLADTVALTTVDQTPWPTPRASDAEGGAVRATNDGHGWYRENREGTRWGVKLRDAVGSAPQEAGATRPPIGGQLNPVWECWLMGYPLGWTWPTGNFLSAWVREYLKGKPKSKPSGTP